jgi:hypothetical protein
VKCVVSLTVVAELSLSDALMVYTELLYAPTSNQTVRTLVLAGTVIVNPLFAANVLLNMQLVELPDAVGVPAVHDMVRESPVLLLSAPAPPA